MQGSLLFFGQNPQIPSFSIRSYWGVHWVYNAPIGTLSAFLVYLLLLQFLRRNFGLSQPWSSFPKVGSCSLFFFILLVSLSGLFPVGHLSCKWEERDVASYVFLRTFCPVFYCWVVILLWAAVLFIYTWFIISTKLFGLRWHSHLLDILHFFFQLVVLNILRGHQASLRLRMQHLFPGTYSPHYLEYLFTLGLGRKQGGGWKRGVKIQ